MQLFDRLDKQIYLKSTQMKQILSMIVSTQMKQIYMIYLVKFKTDVPASPTILSLVPCFPFLTPN